MLSKVYLLPLPGYSVDGEGKLAKTAGTLLADISPEILNVSVDRTRRARLGPRGRRRWRKGNP
jgi:hypothetical protein